MQNTEVKSMRTINILSVVIPLAVALMLGIRQKIDLGAWTKILPHVIGTINTLTSIILILAIFQIKNRNINGHRRSMWAAFVLGGLFLVCYVAYHISNPATKFGGEGAIRYVYYFVLISHILLSFIVLPLVLRAMYFGITNQIDRHNKVNRYAYYIWLYVSISGVISYLMIRPYYA
jgi:putative membrane protein